MARAHRPNGLQPLGMRKRRFAGASLVIVALTAAAFFAGQGSPNAAPDPIQMRDGVPVGVGHSQGGAVAAADDYLATEQASVERDPERFQTLVSDDYTTALRESALMGGLADREQDPRGMRLWARGGQSFTVIGAHRIDWYRGDRVQVTAWAGQIFWGPGQPPCQVWSLGQVTLVWRQARWQVTAMSTLPAPAPAPAELPQASAADDSGAAFNAELGGFTPVSYGSPQ
jgi:hypothetical protein